MVPNIAPEIVSTIAMAVVYRDQGASVDDVINAFPTAPERAQVESWLKELVAAEILDAENTPSGPRYFVLNAAKPYLKVRVQGSDDTRAADAQAGSPTVEKPEPQGTSAPNAGGSRDEAPSVADASPQGASSNQNQGTPTPAGGGDTTQFQQLFDSAIVDIVTHLVTPAGALGILEVLAARTFAEPDRRLAFKEYGTDRLSRLTLGECTRHGLTAQQYALWHRGYVEGTAGTGPQPQPVGSPAGTPEDSPAATALPPKPARRRSANVTEEGQDPEPAGDGTRDIPAGTAAVKLLGTILDAVLARQGAANANPTSSGAAGAPSRASGKALAAALASWVGRILPAGPSPALRVVLVITAVAIVVGIWTWLGSYPWFASVASGVLGVGALLVSRKALSGATRAVPAAPAPVNPAPPASRWKGAWLLAGCLLVIAAVVGTLIYQRVVSHPSKAAVSAYLTTRLAPLPVRVAALTVQYGKAAGSDVSVAYEARLETTEPLYTAVTTADYLRAQAPAEMAAIERANALLRGPNGARLRLAAARVNANHGPAGTERGHGTIAEGAPTPNPGPDDNPPTGFVASGVANPAANVVANSVARSAASSPANSGGSSVPGIPAGNQAQNPDPRANSAATPVASTTANRAAESAASTGGVAGAPVLSDSAPVTQPVPALEELVLVTTQTPPRTSVMCFGNTRAWRQDGAWSFSSDPIQLDRSTLRGEPRPAGPAVFAVDLPPDAERLRALLALHVAFATRIQAAADMLAAELDRENQQRADRLAELLRPGNVYSGTTVTSLGTTVRVVLELVSGEAQKVTAVLRNDGSWMDARMFQGEWSISPGSDAGTLTLRTTRDDRIDEAGPLLEDRRDWTLTLQVRGDGLATASPGNWNLRRLDAAAVSALKTNLSRALIQALSATKPGTIYRGTLTSRVRPQTETLFLRFTDQDPDTAALSADLESATQPDWVRPFRGTIIGNSYRSANAPIRLQSRDNERVVSADRTSALGMITANDSLSLSLRVDGTRLVGQDDRFTYVFTLVRANASETEIEGQNGVGRSTPASQKHDGGGTRDQGLNASPAANAVANPVAKSPANTIANLPANSAASSPANARASSVANSDASRSANSSASKDQRPGTADPRQDDSAADAFVDTLPAFPDAAGAYVLAEGRWAKLPRNNGRVVRTAAQSLNAKMLDLKRMEDALAGITPEPAKEPSGTLMFDGRDTVPAVGGDAVTFVCVGAAAPSAAQMKRYPELKTYPLIELAPVGTATNGSRSTPLFAVVPGIVGFGPNRIAATVVSPRANVAVLRCKAQLSSGWYALWGGPEPCEVIVK